VKLLESYSLASGQKISIPKIFDKYFPLALDKYISFQPYSKNSKNYLYWQCVIDILYPILEKEGIKIVQIGQQGEVPFKGCYCTQGQTTISQSFFIIKNALLNLSTDSFSAHVAGIYNKFLVDLVSNNYSSSVSPFFGDKSKQIILEPNRTNLKPLFQLDEPTPKQIDSILPEKIAESVLKLLNIPYTYNYSSLWFGCFYNHKILECIPNQVVDIKSLGVENAIIRADLLLDEQNIFNQSKISKISLYTDKVLKKELLIALKPSIVELIYLINENNFDIKFVELLYELGIKFAMLTYVKDENIINNIKLQIFDYGMVHKKSDEKPDEVKKVLDNRVEKLYYRTNKYILSNQKIYLSILDYKNNLPINGFDDNFKEIKQEYLENKEFWAEKDFFYILKEK